MRGAGRAAGAPILVAVTLRDYQRDAVTALYRALAERDDNPIIEIPTGGGKTPIIAGVCRDALAWGSRVMVVAHVRELLSQSIEALSACAADLLPSIGVYSAGLGSRRTNQPIIVAGIQSAWRAPQKFGSRDLLLIDEAHRIPPDGEGMYRTLIRGLRHTNPDLRVVGLTATPFRTTTGPLATTGGVLNHICYRIGVRELIVRGWLSPLVSRAGREKPSTAGLHVRAGEFVSAEVEMLMDTDALVASATAEILKLTRERKSVLVFCAGVAHARRVAEKLGGSVVVGETPARERDRIITGFRSGAVKYLCNVDVLTLGFDVPGVDCVVLLRPTASPGLYYQMVGRGFRRAEGKAGCLVLDYGGNVLRHGPVDLIRPDKRPGAEGAGDSPAKECPRCCALIASGYAACPVCGYEFPTRRSHDARAGDADILSGRVTKSRYEVGDICYAVHSKRGAPDTAPRTMRVDYGIGMMAWASEWVCFEHRGYARAKAEAWWRHRAGTSIPRTAAEAVGRSGDLRVPSAIVIRSVSGEKFDRVVSYEWGEVPVAVDNTERIMLAEEAAKIEIGF